jgi:hypothetical protein
MLGLLCTKIKENGSAVDVIEEEIVEKVIKILTGKHTEGLEGLDKIEERLTPILDNIRKKTTEKIIEEKDPRQWICHCGEKMRIKEKPKRKIIGLSTYEIKRRIFHCDSCGNNVIPLEEIIGICGRYSLCVKEGLVLLGKRLPFEEASVYLSKLMGVEVSHQTIQKYVEGIGKKIAVDEKKKVSKTVDSEGYIKNWEWNTAKKKGVAYLEMDGSMVHTREDGWKEVRLGMLFRAKNVVRTDKHHRRITKKKYFSGFNQRKDSLQQFKNRTTQEAYDFGFHSYERSVILSDGARWIWDYADQCHPNAIQILDYFHASEYLGCAIESLNFKDVPFKKQQKKQWFHWLDEGNINKVISVLIDQKQTNEVQKCIRYYENNKERMKYAYYRKLGLEIGSGAIESAHRTVVQTRMKQSGMHWKKKNVQSIVSLRTKYLSGEWDDVVQDYLKAA